MCALKCSIKTVIASTPFDYGAYQAQCIVDGCEPEAIQNYASMSGVLHLAKIMYPEKAPEAAYHELALMAHKPIDVSRGLGDTITKITTALGIPQCSGCKEREGTLNEWFPYE